MTIKNPDFSEGADISNLSNGDIISGKVDAKDAILVLETLLNVEL